MQSRFAARKTPVSLLSAAIAVALFSMPGVALAQQAANAEQDKPDPKDLDKVTVVGGSYRASLEKALEAKRDSAEQIDVVMAEDIGKFPDLNLAESLQRVPGVTIDRDAGEGRSISVRGLGGDFSRVRINGLEALSTTGATDSSGGANRSRGFDFNVFASELFSSLTVRKTQSALVDEGSLGATVDLRVARPFDYEGFTSSIAVQAAHNDLSGTTKPRVSGLIANTWADGRVGGLLSVSYSERSLFEEGFSSVRWGEGGTSGTTTFCSPLGYDPRLPGNNSGRGSSVANCHNSGGVLIPRPENTPENVAAYETARDSFHPRLPRYGRLSHEQTRTGITGSLQFKLADATTLSVDGMYSKLDSTRAENFLETISFSRNSSQGGKAQTIVRAAEVNDRGDLVYGVFDNVDVRSESRFDELTTEFKQFSALLEHRFNDRLDITALVGTSTSEFDNPRQTTVTFDIQNLQGYSWDFRDDADLPDIHYGGIDPADPSAWNWISSPPANSTGSEIRIRPQGTRNQFDNAKVDFGFRANETFTLRGGLSWKRYDMSSYEFRRTSETVVPALPAGTSIAEISMLLTGFGKGLGSSSPSSWLIPDLDKLASMFDIYCNCNTGVAGGDFSLYSVSNGNARGNNFGIREEDTGGYLQLDFDVDLAGRPLRGNAGIRYARTRINARGYTSVGGGTEVDFDHGYNDWLPSLNVAWEATDEFVLRFGAAKVMARPQLAALNPGSGISFNATGGTSTARVGNPFLDPFRATTIDLSAEWYFAEDSLLSVGLFYKDIDTYIQEFRATMTYAETGLPLEWLPAGFDPQNDVDLRQWINTPGGPLKGFEVNYQQPFTFLPGFWKDFGLQLNYTQVESKITYGNSDVANSDVTFENDLVNLSPNSHNATIYYDNGTFSARVSTAYRDNYLQRVPGQNGNDVEGKRATRSVDASMSYKLNKQLSLSLEGINLTDAYNQQFVDSYRDSTSVYHHTGREFLLGLRYKF
jgi:TonB-dependent receptor